MQALHCGTVIGDFEEMTLGMAMDIVAAYVALHGAEGQERAATQEDFDRF